MMILIICIGVPKYTDAIMNNKFAYTGMLLGQKLQTVEMIS
jgi:hypothetical protein